MGWAEDKDTLLAGGYSDPEVQSIAGGIADHMNSNGYSPEDMADYFGRPKEPPTGKLTEYFNQQFKAHLPNEDAIKEAGHPETRMGAVTQAVKNGIVSGYQNSVVGLRARGKLPDAPGTESSIFDDTGDKITNAIGGLAEGVSGIVSDAPTYFGGSLIGGEAGAATGAAIGTMVAPGFGTMVGAGIGGLIGSGGGAFATQRALRAALMQAYGEGGVHSFSQFVDVAKTTATEAAKGFAVGSATTLGGVGGKALSSVLGIGGKAAAALPMATELAGMTAVGAAVDGKMPEPMDLVNNAILMVGMHNVPGMKAAQEKLSNVFTDTAAHPHDVVADALMDPVLKQQILASDPHTPAALSHLIQPDVESSQVVSGGKLIPAQEAASRGHFDFEGTPAEFAKKTEAMFHPNERAKAARAHDPVAFKTVADLSSEVKRLNGEIEASKDTEGLSPEHIEGLKSEVEEHQTRLNEIKENGDAVKSRIADAYAKAHDTLTENLKDHVRNANLSLGDLPETKIAPQFNPEYNNQSDHNLFLDSHAKDSIIAKDDELRQLMGRHANYEPEDGVRDTLAKHPELARIIAPEMVKVTTSETGQKTLRILPKPKKSVERASWDGFKKYVYDDLNPLKNVSADAKEKLGNVPLSAQPDVLALHSRAYLNRAKVMIGDVKETGNGESTFGPYDPRTGKQTNESLYSALNSTPEHDIDGLREYMLYNQIIDENKAGRSTGVNDLEAREYVEKNRDKFEETAKRVTAWANAVNDYAEVSGLLSSERNAAFKEKHPNYVPANRVDEEAGRGGGVKTGANLFKTREGSELPYLDPITSLVQKAENISRAVEENNAKLAAVKLNEMLVEKGHESILEPVETKGGLDEGNENLQFNRSKDEGAKLSDNQMGYYENGEYKVAEFKDPEIGKILQFANGDKGTYKLLTMFAAPANLAAKATRFAVSTGSNFVINHMIRSETFTATVSEQNRLPFIGTMSFLSDAFGKNSPEFVEALKSGALDGIMSDVNRDILNDRKYTLGDEHGALSTVHNTIKTVAGAGHSLINLQEAAKRMSVFNDLKDANPNATWDDILQAGKTARRSSVDGLQKGAGMQFLTSVIPFMHYEIQGLGRNIEAWKENPKAMAARTAMMLGLTAINWYANKNDDDIQNLPNYQKNAFWNFKVGDHVMRIAKDWGEGKVACTLLERTLDYFENHNPRALDGFADTLKNIVPIPFINRSSAIGEAKDVLVNNYNSLTGREYIPASMMKLAPESRAMPYTSELAKQTAGVLGHLNGLGLNLDSPMMVDYAIKQFTGDNGVALVRATETALEKANIIPPSSKPAYEAADIPFVGALISRQATYNAQPLKDFQNEYTRLEQNYNTYQGYLKAGDMDKAQQFADDHKDLFNYTLAKGAHQAISMASKQIQNYNVMPNDRMSPSDKKQTSEDLWKTSIGIAKQTLNQLDDMREK